MAKTHLSKAEQQEQLKIYTELKKTLKCKRFGDSHDVFEDGRIYSHRLKHGGMFLTFSEGAKVEYHISTFYFDGKKKRMSNHRAIATCWCDNPHNHPIVNHIDHNKHNNHPSNLKWVSAAENQVEKFKYYGSSYKNMGKSYSEELVLSIYETCCKSKLSAQKVAKMYGVSHPTVMKIRDCKHPFTARFASHGE